MRTRRTITLPVSAHTLWSFVTDWERQADWMADADRVEVVSSVREGIGVRLRVRTRLFGVAAFTEPMEVVGWDPPRTLAIRHGGPVAGTGTWTLEPIPGGTRFTWTEEVALGVPLVGALAARCYAPILSWLMRRSMRELGRRLLGRNLDVVDTALSRFGWVGVGVAVAAGAGGWIWNRMHDRARRGPRGDG